jgi:hypothetical protein
MPRLRAALPKGRPVIPEVSVDIMRLAILAVALSGIPALMIVNAVICANDLKDQEENK